MFSSFASLRTLFSASESACQLNALHTVILLMPAILASLSFSPFLNIIRFLFAMSIQKLLLNSNAMIAHIKRQETLSVSLQFYLTPRSG